MQTPKISVIIPVYNTERYLRDCLSSVCNQTLKELEVICVDDGSKDGSLVLLHSLAKEDNRITVISQENKRQGGARNTGLRVAKGEYVSFLDSDDTISLNYLEVLFDTAKRHDADIACTNILKVYPKWNKETIKYNKEEVFTEIGAIMKACSMPPSFYTTNRIIRRSLIEDNNILFPEYKFHEDVEFAIHTLIHTNKLVTVPDAFYYYRYNAVSTTKSKQDISKQLSRYEALKNFIGLMDKNNIVVAKKYRSVTKRHFTYCGVNIWKVRDNGKYLITKLFDFIPIFIRRTK